MTRVVLVTRLGGPEVLELAELEVGAPGAGEVRLRQTAIGLNFIDIYYRTGLYPGPDPPFVPGVEAAGVVEELGQGVTEVAVGDRVGYAGPLGAYAAERLITAERLVPLPDGVTDEEAAALMLKGLTARYLLRRTYRVVEGDVILIHAAAGGVGLILCQWARHLGAVVIGTVGSEEKAELARQHGCQYPLLYRTQDWVARVRELSGGRGVPVVYDSVGAATFEGSLDCLAPLGTMVSFGNASGPPPAIEVLELARRGSLVLTRPTLWNYVETRADLLEAADELLEAQQAGALRARIGARAPLEEAAQAQRALEGRRTSGATVLVP